MKTGQAQTRRQKAGLAVTRQKALSEKPRWRQGHKAPAPLQEM